MLKSYPLAMQGVEFRGHGVTGIYEMGERIAFVSRLGTILPARPELVIQEHDQLYFAISGEDPLPLRDILTRAPRLED